MNHIPTASRALITILSAISIIIQIKYQESSYFKMKLLFVFVSALVLVAQGKAAPSKEEERVKEVQSVVVPGYAVVDAGEEGGVEPQGAYAEEAPAVFEPNVVGAGPEQRGFAVGEPVADGNIYGVPESLYIPIISRACTNSSCVYLCNLLGYPKGLCVSTTTCQCYF